MGASSHGHASRDENTAHESGNGMEDKKRNYITDVTQKKKKKQERQRYG